MKPCGLINLPTRLILALAFAAVLLSACAAPSASPSAVPPAGDAPAEAPAAEIPTAEAPTAVASIVAILDVASDPVLGQILVGAGGLTLYVFTEDAPDRSSCNRSCQASWPPLLTQGAPVLGVGVDPAMVGAAALADGSRVVTYNHMPLYYWHQDFKAGDTNGQGRDGVWYVVSPAGQPIGLAAEGAGANDNSNLNANDNTNDNENENDNGYDMDY